MNDMDAQRLMLNIKRVTVLERKNHPDVIFLELLDQIEPIHPYINNLCLEFRAAESMGINFVNSHLNLKVDETIKV